MSKLRQSLSVLFLCIEFLFTCGYQPVSITSKKHKTLSDKKKVFAGVKCQYTDKMHVKYADFNKLNAQRSEYYIDDEVNLKEYTRKYAPAVASKKSAPMYLKWVSDVVGYGIYATQDIKSGDFIGEYTGVLRQVKDDKDDLDYAWYYTLDSHDGKKLVIDGKEIGNELRFINHALNPNTMRIDVLGHDGHFHLCYVAARDIPKDHQLTVSYGSGYWSSRGVKPENF